MKKLAGTLVFFSLSLFVFAGYAQEPNSLKEVSVGEAFIIKAGQQVIIKGTKIKITFLSVPEDSRCPADTDCIWAGNANPNFELRKAKKKMALVNLNTLLEPKAVEFLGYKIRLAGLSPYPTTKAPIPPGDYQATLIVTSQ